MTRCSMLVKASTIALLVVHPGCLNAQSKEAGPALCYSIQNTINAIMGEHTHTACVPVSSRVAGDGLALGVIASKPVFFAEATKKAWLIVAALGTGHVLNTEGPGASVDVIMFADSALVAHGYGYFVPASVVKSLQRRVKADQITLDAAYSELLARMTREQSRR